MTTDRTAVARSALTPLEPGYVALFDALVRQVQADDRVAAMWLGGSVARGVADRGSDLDALLAVHDDALGSFASGWSTWLAEITDVLMAREMPGLPGSFYATTVDCLRLDVVTEPVTALGSSPYRHRLLVLDRDDVVASAVPEPDPAPPPDAAQVAELIEEFYRQQAIFPAAVVARQDWLLGVVGVNVAQQLLYQLFVATNAPLPPMGVKQWSARLTERQRQVLAALPSPRADRDSVVDAMKAVRDAVRHSGRQAVEDVGMTWPGRLDLAVARYWARNDLDRPQGA